MATAEQIKERPIIFSGRMVRAILDGRKTQTRRLITHPGDFLGAGGKSGGDWDNPRFWGWEDPENPLHYIVLSRNPDAGDTPVRCPYGVPGDRLWVRETFTQRLDDHGYFVYTEDGNLDSSCCHYAADGYEVLKGDGDGGIEYRKDGTLASPWKSPLFMPRSMSRITLEITGIWIERLISISTEDAIAEGFAGCAEFLETFYRINAKRIKVNENPWLWVLEFMRLEKSNGHG